MLNQWPLRNRLWLFFGLGVAVTLGGVWAVVTGRGPIAVLVFIVAVALLLRGFLDLARARRRSDDA